MTTPDPAPNSEPPPATPVDVVLTDYADLGTAFGLDASVASAAATAAATSAASEPAGAPAPPAPPWEHRLTRRSGL